MTVRVNKPAFNIREKLSELEKPIGMKGADLMKSETVKDARGFISAGRKNLVINGDLRIWQRSISSTINTAVNTIHQTADRWNNYHNTGGSVTEARSTDVPPGQGFYYSLKHTVTNSDTSMGTGDYHCHRYDIEGYDVARLMWGTPYAKPITVSFWVKCSVPGDYGFCVRPGENNDRLYVDTIRIIQPNTWKKYSFIVPGCTDGTWDKTNGRGIQIQISHAMGTEYHTSTLRTWISSLDVSPTTQVNWMASSGNTWYITGLQVEEGTNATEFEHRSYGEELLLCQRYYWEIGSYQSGNWAPLSLFIAGNGTRAFGSIRTPVTMRSHPAITFSNVNLHSTYTENVTSLVVYSQTGRNSEYNGFSFEAKTASGLVSGQVYRMHVKNVGGTSGYIRFNAEL